MRSQGLSPNASRRPTAVLAVGLLAIGGLVACAPPTSTPERSSNSLVIAANSGLDTPNELLTPADSLRTALFSQLFLRLFEEQPDFDEGPPSFSPQLARSWQFSDDRLELNLQLDPEARWSDGTPMTAQDVRFSWQAQSHPDVAWDYSFTKESIRDVVVVSDSEVRFEYHRATPTQMLDTNEGVILPAHLFSALPFDEWRENPAWFWEHLATSGPFTLEATPPDGVLTLIPNPEYRLGSAAKMARVSLPEVVDPVAQLNQLLAGDVGLVPRVQHRDRARVESREDLRLHSLPTRNFTFLAWNTEREPFDDPTVRRALAQAIDLRALVTTLWGDSAVVGTSPVLSTVWAHDESLAPVDFAPEAARRAFAQAGFSEENEDGVLERQGREFAFELLTSTGAPSRRDALELIQADLARVGVRTEIATVESAAFNLRNQQGEFDATLGGFAIDTSLDLSFFVHSESIDAYNYSRFANRRADELLEGFRTLLSQEDGRELLVELQRLLHEEQPFLVLWESRQLLAARSDLTNIQSNPLSVLYRLQDWELTSP